MNRFHYNSKQTYVGCISQYVYVKDEFFDNYKYYKCIKYILITLFKCDIINNIVKLKYKRFDDIWRENVPNWNM